MPISPRPILASEYDAALYLWQRVFGAAPGYFERYYAADPEYQPGDTLGTWEGTTLTSAVHLCRRPVDWQGGRLLCGGIANVATHPDFRRQGLSRRILREIIAKMERENFHFSLLGTGTHGHYAALGWEQIERPRSFLSLWPELKGEAVSGAWQTAGSVESLRPLYAHAPRPLQFIRSPQYFEDWTGWNWRRQSAESCVTREGYVVAVFPEGAEQETTLVEWRAGDEQSEHFLLNTACAEAARRGCLSLHLPAMPQFLSESDVAKFGQVEPRKDGGGMIRRVALTTADFAEVVGTYRNGQATWWDGDGF